VPAAGVGVLELRLALDGNVPLVLTSENRSGEIAHFVAELDGAAFVPVGGGTIQSASGAVVRAALTIDPQGRPVAVVRGSGNALRLLRFEGGGWTAVGSALAAGSFINEPSIVFDGNQPVVAWNDNLDAMVRRFDPVAADWGELRTLRTNVGTLSELRRLPSGGPIWGALTTGPFRSELRAVTTSALP
jgi:hypothetical protein